jgi:diacylglycerol kinase family enzyme/membrane-associated phospholipid phosphatase
MCRYTQDDRHVGGPGSPRRHREGLGDIPVHHDSTRRPWTESAVRDHPVLIVNPLSGSGLAAEIGLVHAARRLGIETVALQPFDDLADLAHRIAEQGADHLMMAGGDGSLAIVAEVAIARDLPFSCVPVGTRNHFAMDLGLDRTNPLQALDAAVDGCEMLIDVGVVAGRVFLNNVSFGVYPRAIADPGYRNHRARSIADAAVGTVGGLANTLSIDVPDGGVVPDVEMLLISNNPYRFIGPPDFARRPSLDSGTLSVIVADRRSRLEHKPPAFTRWQAPTLIVRADSVEVSAGVDGELRTFRAPIDVAIAPRALRVLIPRRTSMRTLEESIEHITERAIVNLSGLPALPRPPDPRTGVTLLRRVDEIDAVVFERIAGWQSPVLDRLMPALSKAASHSKIWITMAAAMSLFGGTKGRRTAAVSLTAVASTSLFANLIAKGLFRRQRPTDHVPQARRLPAPDSSSMPSGHTASAAAFSRVIGRAYPKMRIPLGALAAAIGFSRVYTGVHHPTDVVAGWFLGRGIGTLADASASRGEKTRRAVAGRRSGRSHRS